MTFGDFWHSRVMHAASMRRSQNGDTCCLVVDTAVVVSTWCGGGRGLVVVVRGARKSREWDGEAELDCPLGSIASGRGRTPRNGQ